MPVMNRPYLPAVKTYRDKREVCQANKSGVREYKRRTLAMIERQENHCAIGAEYIDISNASFDHQDGRGSGGGHRDDRIEIDGQWHNAALCWTCNGAKGSRRYHWVNGEYVPCQ